MPGLSEVRREKIPGENPYPCKADSWRACSCKGNTGMAIAVLALVLAWVVQSGCQTPAAYRRAEDSAAFSIIKEKQKQALGKTGDFTLDRPGNTLRRRLLLDQKLPCADGASLGADQVKPIEHWPEKDYPRKSSPNGLQDHLSADQPLRISLLQALQIGARNSFEYQTRKENIFRAALDLDLERNGFRHTFTGQVQSLFSSDGTGDRTLSGVKNSGEAGLSRKLKSGAELTTFLAVDLANLLTLGGASSLGLMADATVTVPLLRGSGKHIVTEPLIQAERDVVYAMYEFERFKRTFAVQVASEYLSVLQLQDQVTNAEENYKSLMASARRSRRLADAGRLPEIQVDQATQNELSARNRWISAVKSCQSRLDSLKGLLGLPPDANLELDRSDLEKLVAPTRDLMADIEREEKSGRSRAVPPADTPIEFVPPDREKAGPLEMDQSQAIQLALKNRLDLRIALEKVYDAQRAVVVAADALGAELTLLGSARLGEGRSIATATLGNADLQTAKGIYSALLTLDLALDRKAEAVAYRKSFIDFEGAVREVQDLEDQIKLSLRHTLATLLESRESLYIQAKSVYVAERRVKSTNVFLEAGRAEIRDLLEAQDALLSAQNGLTAAAINYRIAELELQRDLGLLRIDETGLWQEYSPEEMEHDQEK